MATNQASGDGEPTPTEHTDPDHGDPDLRRLTRRVDELEARLRRLTAEHGFARAHIERLQQQFEELRDAQPSLEHAVAKVKRIPAGVQRRVRTARMRRAIDAELPEVSAAELDRRRKIVEQFVAETTVTGPHAGGSGLVLPVADEPLVSVIIPVHNAIDETMACLRSIAKHAGSAPIEVIVANDESDEAEFAEVRDVSGLTVVDNATNLGFLRTCNEAAKSAQGRYLWLLNSDTEITEGALDAMVATFEQYPDAGAVGSMLVFPDGSVQEGGGIVWSDASAWNYGRGLEADHPDIGYPRIVDYCSAASLMVRRDLWEELGGFDTAFSPAYYEDTDLCMQLAERGHPVVYQPAAQVVHHEGASYGTDVTQEGKHHQVLNQETFYRKWSEQLRTRRPNAAEPLLERERTVTKRALIIDARMLTPDQDSGSLRMLNTLRALQRNGYKCTFVPQNMMLQRPYDEPLRVLGVEVTARPYVDTMESFLRARGPEFDIVLLSRLEVVEEQMSRVQRLCPRAKIIYDTVDLHFLRQVREEHITGAVSGGFDHVDTRDRELAAVQAADLTLVCSTAEVPLLEALVPDAAIEVLGNIHDVPDAEVVPVGRDGLLFVGGFEHPPNIDAVRWLVADIMPLIIAERSGATVHVVGSKMPPDLLDLASPNVQVHGYVEDLDPLYDAARVCVAPLRFGAGVKGKITQALAHGVPTVATSIAVEGSGFVDGEHLLVADDPATFADACVRLMADDAAWADVSAAGQAALVERFGFEQAVRRVADIIAIVSP
ncbi:MAG: glycosyltransferase [Acidimicrobiales bacterium]|nr:glycosyltransferase [Acidimicrobiales bacterium]